MPTRQNMAIFVFAAAALATLILPGVNSISWAAETTRETSGFYEDALIRFNKRDFAGAIIQLRNVLQKDPTNLAARILLGKTHIRLGAAASAEKELELARKAGADEELIIEDLARAYILQRKFEELLESIRPGNRSPSIEAQVLTARALANYEHLRYEKAMAEFEQAIALAPERSAPLLGEARILMRQGKLAEAEIKVKAAESLKTGYPDLWYIKGELHRVKHELEAAVASYGKAIKAIPGHLPARLKRAVVLIELGRHAEAVPDLDYIRRFDQDDPQTSYLEYLIYSRMGENRKAQASLRRTDLIIRNLNPEYVRSHGPTLLLSGVVAHALKKMDQARFYLNEYIKLVPNHPGSRRMLGGILVKLNRAENGIEILRPNLVMAPNDWQSLALLGAALTRNGETAEATKALQKAVEVMPDRPTLRTRLALSRIAGGQDEAAVADLEAALRLSPKAVKPAILLGMVHLRLRNHDQAAAVARRMIERNGDSPDAYNLLGGARLGRGDRRAARKSFEKALSLAPEFGPARANIARLNVNEGKLEAARQSYQQMLRYEPQAIAPMVALASIAETEGDLALAIRWMEKVGGFKRKDVQSQLRLITLYHRAGRPDSALVLAVRLKQEYASNLKVLAAVGGTELETGAIQAAVKTFRRMANMRPDSASDLLNISRLQISAKDYDGAFNTLRRAVWVEPGNYPAQQEIIRLEIYLGRLDEAQERAEELLLVMPDSGIGERLRGDVMMARKDYPAAINDYQGSINRTGGNSALAIRIYRARFSAGLRDEAIKMLETWVAGNGDDFAAQRTLAAGYTKRHKS